MKAIEKILDGEMADTWRESIGKDFDAALRPKLTSGRVYPAFFPMDPGDVVLNLGCGLGPQALTYKGRFSRMVGADIDLDKLAFAKRAADHYRLALHPCRCDVEHLPFPKESFDTVIAIDVIEHVLDPGILLSEAFRVLRSSGHLLITFPCLLDDWKRLLFSIRKLTRIRGGNGLAKGLLRNLYSAARATAAGFVKKKNETRKAAPAEASPVAFNPDTHKHDKSPRQWLALIEGAGFKVVKSRSTTLFPPLHALGVAKFWFTNDRIFKMDSMLSRQRWIRNFGQSMVCLARKKDQC
jgi:SAM-dependent methyltransferase